MNPIKVMVNGLPGNVAQIVARHIIKDPRFELLPYSITGPEIQESEYKLETLSLGLIQPDTKMTKIDTIKSLQGQFLSVDFTHPSAVNPNAEFYCRAGLPFQEDQIVKIRDPEIQQTQWGIEEKYLTGHGWHTYTLISEDRTVRFEFTHNINGREIYGRGTLDALLYLSEKVKAGVSGKVFTMIDVLKGI